MNLDVKIGAVLSPVSDIGHVLGAARAADEAGLDAVGLWDHYHSERPDWGYVAGWSTLGAIAAVTRRVHIVPMVLNSLHHELGVLAKESSMLALASDGRFELGIGAGDWPSSFKAWGRPFPPADRRLDELEERVGVLREIWTGQAVSFEGSYLHLAGAICSPVPPHPPRVVVGAGGSVRTMERAIRFADEVNVYSDLALVSEACRLAAAAPSRPDVSVFVDWSWANWPPDPVERIARLEAAGVKRVLVGLGSADMPQRVAELVGRAGD